MAYRSGGAFSLLIVCTGNVCRSPAIERLLGSAFAARGVAVRSCGTGALTGRPIEPPMARLLEEQGVSSGGFAARGITGEMLAGADLVLTATRELRGGVVEILPSVVRCTFTVWEFARLAAQVSPADLDAAAGPYPDAAERLDALIPHAAARRAQVPVELDDIVDPYRQRAEVYEESFGQIVEAVREITRVVLEPNFASV